MDLQKKVALITGGASGIGLACAKEFLAAGIKAVTLVDINDNDGSKLTKELNQVYPSKVIFVKANVSDKSQLNNAFQNTIETFGNLDIVLNNAGIANEFEPAKCYEVNILGVTNCLQLAIEDFLPKYKSSNSEGIVINVASTAGLYPRTWFMVPAYSASKAAVLGLTMSYSQPLHYEKTNVKVIAICPGKTVTPLAMKVDPGRIVYLKEFMEAVEPLPAQEANVLAKNIIELLGKASNGSVWRMEGGLIEEIDYVRNPL